MQRLAIILIFVMGCNKKIYFWMMDLELVIIALTLLTFS